MQSARKYIVFGPTETLKRFGSALLDEIKPKYSHQYNSSSSEDLILVSVFEEYQRQLNSSTALTSIFEFSGKSLKINILPTGGRMGFRGSSLDNERPLMDQVTDFIMDYAKRYGLSVQEIEDTSIQETE